MALFVYPRTSAFGLNVRPAEGSYLNFFDAGTTTPKTVYSDPDLTTPHPTDIEADANGRFPAIYLSGTYKVILYDPNDNVITTDDDQAVSAGEVQLIGDFDSTTNGGEYPATGNLGHMYRVTETFTLGTDSGSHHVLDGDFIIANKNGATALDADWDVIKGFQPELGVIALTAGASIATNCLLGNIFTVTLDQNSTLANPTNKIVGQTYTWKITNGATAYTLAFGTNFNFTGSDQIGLGPGLVTIIKGTVISATEIRAWIVRSRAADFDVKNMLINVGGADSLTLTADVIQYVNRNGETREEYNVSDAWVPSTDIVGGETGTASQLLQAWRDSAKVMKLTLCEEGTADGTTAGFLVASGNTIKSRGGVAGDYLYNTADYTSTKITTTPANDGDPVAVDDDIFESGETYKLVKAIPPSSLGEYAACLGFGKQDSGSDLVNSGYSRPELQEFPTYIGDHTGNLEFTISEATTAITATDYAEATIYQKLGFGMTPIWKNKLLVSYSIASNARTVGRLEVVGVVNKTGVNQAIAGCNLNHSVDLVYAEAVGGDNEYQVGHASATTSHYGVSADVVLDYKATFATRS